MTATATFCATVVDDWVKCGVTTAFVAPGSRSTPLALALSDRSERGELAVHVMHDERSASFAALGHGLATGSPAILLCTSGTAATHFHGAVAEADLSCVPMLVCTADRPPELWGVGAPQTISQANLYGSSVRSFEQCDPPEDTEPGTWRAVAHTSYVTAADPTKPGPVHLNMSFRDPLVGRSGPLPEELGQAVLDHKPRCPTESDVNSVLQLVLRAGADTGGVIIAGRGESDPQAVLALGDRLGWPVLADHRSGARLPDRSVGMADQLLRSTEFRASAQPDLVLRFGEPHSSKELGLWIKELTSAGATIVNAVPWGRNLDPELVGAQQVPESGLAGALLERIPDEETPSSEGARWLAADQAAEAAVAGAGSDVSEPHIARAALRAVPRGGALVVSSSMPVRDVEWFGQPLKHGTVYANRGANGIDGVTSTALGVALTGVPTVCLIGDVAFLHDINVLVALKDRAVDLTILVVNNDGGGIFGFLPQHEVLDEARYEKLFGTPHGTNLAQLAAAHGIETYEWGQTSLSPAGVRIVIAPTDRTHNLEQHASLTHLIHDAVRDTAAAWA